MRDSSEINSSWILVIDSDESPSNLKTSFGVVLDALNKPHPSLKFTLSPSIVIFSPSNRDSLINLSTISNLFSSVTVIFNSGVENESGNFENISEIDSLDFDIISEVKKHNADIGFAFDGDGDRVGLITNKGEMIFPDKQMMLFSEDILKEKVGGIVFDVKCSNHLENIISSNGGSPIMSAHFSAQQYIIFFE